MLVLLTIDVGVEQHGAFAMTPKLVQLGAGWAGMSLLRASRAKKGFDLTVISRNDHMVFTPLLASTATGALEQRSIMEMVRPLAAVKKAHFMNAEVTRIAAANDTVHLCAQEFSLKMPDAAGSSSRTTFLHKYDALIVAVGATVNTFGLPGVHEHAFFLKEAQHAVAVRRRMHDLFEYAALPVHNSNQRRALLTFVVCGAGPTGVELTAEICDWVRDMNRSARYGALANEARVVLVEASGDVLNAFDKTLRAYTLGRLRHGRVEVKLGSAVKKVESDAVVLQDSAAGGLEERLPCGMVVWTAGIGPRDVVTQCDLRKTAGSRLISDEYLLCDTPGSKPVFAIGDAASIRGNELLPIAQVAEQQGKYVAELLTRAKGLSAEELRAAGEPFKFASKGMLAYVGGWRGVAKLQVQNKESSFAVKYSGLLAWFTWRFAYLSKLGSYRNKLQVPFDFVKTTLFGRDISSF